MKAWVDDDGSDDDDNVDPSASNPALPPGLVDSSEVGRVHVTKSQAANEQAHRQNERQGKPAP